MLDLKFIRNNLEQVKQALSARGVAANLDNFEIHEQKRRQVLPEIESLRARRNAVSEQIAGMKRKGEDTESLVLEMREVSNKIRDLEQGLTQIEEVIETVLLDIPNLPHASVPLGRDSADNPVIKKIGEPPKADFELKAHWDIGEGLKILDFERAAKISGARFPLYFGAGAALERALIQFMLNLHTTRHGYTEVLPPFIVNRKTMTGTGQLPKFEEDLFKIDKRDLFLIPTAEVPVTNIFRDEILEQDQLPIYYTAYTPCFRSEAGSHGKDTRGLIRQHQFNKVELVKFVEPEHSYQELESLLDNAETILRELELPYQVVTLCSGDLGFSAAKTYDIEVWMPGQNAYREISSCSNFEDFQARRANIRFRRKGKKGVEWVHTLNGSGLAVGRTFAAILENYQQADGSMLIPKALQSYLGREKITL